MLLTDLFEAPIKLSGFARTFDPNSPATRCLREFETFCSENPLDHQALVFGNDAVIKVARGVSEPNDSVEIRDIRAIQKGGGAKALGTLCQIADKHGCSLYLHAKGYAHVPTAKLVPYYERFGFTHQAGDLSYLDDVAKTGDGFSDWEEHEGVDMERAPHPGLREAYLTTAKIDSGYQGKTFPVEIFQNPSRTEFAKAIRKADFRVARGNLYPDGTLLVCYVEEAEHHAIDDAMRGTGDFGTGNFERLFLNPTGVTFYGDDHDDPPRSTIEQFAEELKSSPALRRIYGRQFDVRED
jgi:hypothetical protein